MTTSTHRTAAAATDPHGSDGRKGNRPITAADAPSDDPNQAYSARNVAYLMQLRSVRTVYAHAREWGGVYVTPRHVVFPRHVIDALIQGTAA
jgi:hypothetical protein